MSQKASGIFVWVVRQRGATGKASVTCQAYQGRRTTNARKELAELDGDVFVAAVHQKRDGLDSFQDGGGQLQGLRSHLRAIAVVNAVVPSLEDCSEKVLKVHARSLAGIRFARRIESRVGRLGDSEQPLSRVRPADPRVEEVAEELAAIAEELVEADLSQMNVP
jgi:hypothetical protein